MQKCVSFFSLAVVLFFLFCSPFTAFSDQKITIGSGGTGGTYYPFAVAIAELLNQKLQVEAEGISTGGSAQNNEDLKKKAVEMAMIQNDVAFYAYEGLENVPSNQEIRAIGTLYSEDVHIVVRQDSGIKTLKDMIGKRIAIGNTSSGNYRNAKQILETVGIFRKILKDYSGFKEAAQKLKKGEIDGLFYTVGWPTKGISELANSTKVRFIGFDRSLINQMVTEFPFYVSSFIPSGTYRGQSSIQTIAVKAMLAVREDLTDSLVYAITKSIFENLDFLITKHKKWGAVSLMQSQEGVGIPFHKGAESYFSENSLPVKVNPYSRAQNQGYVQRGTRLKIFKERWRMYQISTQNGIGWVKKEDVSDVITSEIQGYEVQAASLNFRSGPSLKNYPLALVRQGEKLEKLGEIKNPDDNIRWFQVTRENGMKGWVSSNPRYLKSYTSSGLSGTVKLLLEKNSMTKEVEELWLKEGTVWEVDEGGEIYTQIKKLRDFFRPVDQQVLNEKLDLFELRNRLTLTSNLRFQERIRLLEERLDENTKNSITEYLKEIERRM